VEVEVDPLLRAAPFATAEKLAVEAPRGGEIVDRKGKMEGRQAHAIALRGAAPLVEAFVNPP